jgi:hypothetical protein
VTLTWSPAIDDVAVARYAVYRDGRLVETTTERQFTVGGLECGGRSYAIAVEARDAAGNGSPRAAIDAATAACPRRGLVAAYSLDRDATDDSLNGNDGTLVGTAAVAGRYGGASAATR